MSITMTGNDKQCYSRGCNNRAQHSLKVLFLNRVGFFCESCKISLLNDNLVEEVEEEGDHIIGLDPEPPEPAKPAVKECKHRAIEGGIYNASR